MSAIKRFIDGFRLTDGTHLNLIVNTLNNITGNGTPQAGTFSTLNATGATTLDGAVTLGNAAGDAVTVTGTASFAEEVAAGGGVAGDLTGNVTGNVTGDTTGAHNGTVGATTPAAGAFTTLAASGNVGLTGAVFALNSFTNNITAFAGGGQASATQLTTAINRVTTVATAADSVKLPAPTTVGQIVVVINADAAESMQVFGSGTDTINGVATGTGVAQAAGLTALYVAVTTGAGAAWHRLLSA